LYVWYANRARFGDFFADGKWAALCLNRAIAELNPERALRLPPAWREAVADELLRRYEADEAFSVAPVRLARLPVA
jgi:hypothetical protein